ncbi:MAG: hypothetical protein AAF515_01610 [Pseudomonadota bacterium]
MQLIDPTGTSSERRLARAAPLDKLDGAVIGLLNNNKVNADVLLRETAALFEARHGCSVIEMRHKMNASAPAPSDKIEDLAAHADFLITAMGD